jgi:SAM-dependent methyltransferase
MPRTARNLYHCGRTPSGLADDEAPAAPTTSGSQRNVEDRQSRATIQAMFTEWDASAVFDDDYLYFYEGALNAERSDAETELIWALADLQSQERVLDLACGHGRLSNRLAAKGARVVGLDVTPLFLERARQHADALRLDVEYVQGDMRDLRWRGEFDLAVNWFTAFGYFDDETNRAVLAQIHNVLRPHGRLLLELNHGPVLMRSFMPAIVTRRGNDAMIDEQRFDPTTGRVHTDRTVIREGRVRTFDYSTRLFAFPELRDWLHAAGFTNVEGFDSAGEKLSGEARRMVVKATRE